MAQLLAKLDPGQLTGTVNTTQRALSAELQQLADDLFEARMAVVPIPQPSAANPALTVDDAYAVQGHNIARRIASGERAVGHKIGLTSLAIQQQLGVDQPDFGVITDAMVIADGESIDPKSMIAPRVEAEFAFRIGHDLPASPTLEELTAAIDGVAVALEIIDSRVADWKIGLVDTVADNASAASIVTGAMRPATTELLAALPDAVIAMAADGVDQISGPGSAVLGDPLVSLHWLATAIGKYGDHFSAGDVVLAGAVAKAFDLELGTTWTAASPGFEPVTLLCSSTSETK